MPYATWQLPLSFLRHTAGRLSCLQRAVALQHSLAQLQGHWWRRLAAALDLVSRHYSAACVRSVQVHVSRTHACDWVSGAHNAPYYPMAETGVPMHCTLPLARSARVHSHCTQSPQGMRGRPLHAGLCHCRHLEATATPSAAAAGSMRQGRLLLLHGA